MPCRTPTRCPIHSSRSRSQTPKPLSKNSRTLRSSLATLGVTAAGPTSTHLAHLSSCYDILTQDADQLSSLLIPRQEKYTKLHATAQDVVDAERNRLTEAVKDLETLDSRLEYEIEGLKSRAEDVEDAIAEFEKQVAYTEERVAHLTRGQREGQLLNKTDVPSESWLDWFGKILAGRPNEAAVKALESKDGINGFG